MSLKQLLIASYGKERYEVSNEVSKSKCGKIRSRKNSVFGYFSRSASLGLRLLSDVAAGLILSFERRLDFYSINLSLFVGVLKYL